MAPKTVVAPTKVASKVATTNVATNNVAKKKVVVEVAKVAQEAPQKIVANTKVVAPEAPKVVAPEAKNVLKNNANEVVQLMQELPYFNDFSTEDTPSIKVPEKPEEIIKIITKIKQIAEAIDYVKQNKTIAVSIDYFKQSKTYTPDNNNALYQKKTKNKEKKTLSNRIVKFESNLNKGLQKQFRLLEDADAKHNASAHTNATSITSSKITNLENPEQQKKTSIANNVHLNTLYAKNPQVNDLNKQEIQNNQGFGSSKVIVLSKEIIDEDKNFKNILLNIEKLQEEETRNQPKALTYKSTYDEILAASRINKKDENIKKKITQLKIEAMALKARINLLGKAHIEATKQETINLALKNADQTALNLPNKTLANLTSSNPSNTGTSVKTAKNASTPSPNTTASISLNPSPNTTATKPSTTNPATANTAIKPTNTINPAINPANTSTVKPASANTTTATTLAQNTQTTKKTTQQTQTKADALYQTYINYERTKIEIKEHKNKLDAIAKKANGFSFLRDILDIHTGTIWNTFVPNAFIGDPHRVEKRIKYLENTILPNTQEKYNIIKNTYDNAVKELNERLKPVSEHQTQPRTINAHNTTLKLKQTTEFATEKSLLDAKFNDDTQKIILEANKQFDNYYNQTLAEEATNNAIANTATATATDTATAISKLTNTNQKHSLISQEPVYANLPVINPPTIYENVPVPVKGGKRTILTKKHKHIIRNKHCRSHKSHNKKLRTRKTHMKRRTMRKHTKLN